MFEYFHSHNLAVYCILSTLVKLPWWWRSQQPIETYYYY